MSSPNKQWHATHRLSEYATPLERISWHQAHQKNCGCNPVPHTIQKMMPPSYPQS